MVFDEDAQGLRHNSSHKKRMTLQELANVQKRPIVSETEPFEKKLKSWGIREDDIDARASRDWLARVRLSPGEQDWLFRSAEAIAEAERAKAAYNPKSDAQYNELCNITASAARLTKEICRMFPPPWIEEQKHIGALVARLAAFVEGGFNATKMIDVREAVGGAASVLKAMTRNRQPKQRFYWDQIATLSWLASGKNGARISERTVRRYVKGQSSRPSPAQACWRRNRRIVWEALWLNPLQRPLPSDWKYEPERDGLPRLIAASAFRRQRNAIEAFTEIAKYALSGVNLQKIKPQKAAQKQN
jgi:hypothetical protein